MGGLAPQQFCLKWNNHQTNLVSVVDELYSRQAFVDVTLVCEGVSVKAHKLVLSACSPFFQTLFADNPCAHPIIIMNQTRLADLKAVVEFMYRGSVNVSQDQLASLLQTAEMLKVKGLAEVATTECDLPNAEETTAASSKKPKRRHTPPPTTPPRKQTTKMDVVEETSTRDSAEYDPTAPSTSKTRSSGRHIVPASRRTFDHSYSDDKTNWVPRDSRNNDPGPVPRTRPDLNIVDVVGDDVLVEGTMCRVCSRVFSSKGNLKRHMLMHRPYRPKHQCNLCFKLFSWPGDLRTHIRVVHQEGGKTTTSVLGT